MLHCLQHHPASASGRNLFGRLHSPPPPVLARRARNTLTAIRYREEDHMLDAAGPGFHLMHDNARPHEVHRRSRMMEALMLWTGLSAPRTWSTTGTSCPVPRTGATLHRRPVRERIGRLIKSVPTHCREVIQAQGGHTHTAEPHFALKLDQPSEFPLLH